MIKKLFFNVLSVFISMFLVGYTAYAQLESMDIGDAADNPGSTEISDGTYTIKGSGSDIWDAADGFRFAYTEVSGDFEAVVHQVSIELSHEWAKGGIHARQSVEPGAANAQVIVTGGGAGGCQITWRAVEGGASDEFMDDAPGPWKDGECWLKLTRKGDEFHGYISENGKDWLDLRSITVEMDEPILVGLAVCGLGDMANAVYDDFTITQNGQVIFPADATAVKSEGKLSTTWGEIKSR
ncbi:TPA: DUF1349 domain-containing protein [Candidatus Poribacteria bacterium]|nr:DUF1349 domain-containing protein [Candidatus Poribacteria bacterium]